MVFGFTKAEEIDRKGPRRDGENWSCVVVGLDRSGALRTLSLSL